MSLTSTSGRDCARAATAAAAEATAVTVAPRQLTGLAALFNFNLFLQCAAQAGQRAEKSGEE